MTTTVNKNTVIRHLLMSLCLGLLTLTAQAGIDITYIHNDALGSAVAGTDEQGNVKWRSQYAPYGEERLGERSAFGIRSGYTGHRDDPETGLTYMGGRYYSPAIGRFMGVDPAGTDASDIYSFNRYAYANNNPYKYVDPDGKSATLVLELTKDGAIACGPWCAVGGAVIGVGIWLGIDEAVAYFNENADNNSGSSEEGCIYCVGGDKTSSGKDYIGSTDDLKQRQKDKSDGRDRTGAEVVDTYPKGDRDTRRAKEQQAINDRGGVGELDNKRNEVAPKQWPDKGITPP